ncbi:DUF916 and DUF3324 domain-containing protein [Lapidilactobacillus bayanensis]|uniref:DUF916 and DUF3324 domain-containing protein n=1 Tax=Lapidilactobacillus bayanensis TaxID=2485998 RepID=UPI000F790625|nr:DUF916 and DUF3324 domain-containing protein [Lapidilactobacillus bayanensis]
MVQFKQQKFRFWLMMTSVLLGLFFLKPQSVSAAGTSFTMGIKQPANQIEKSANYFDLLIQPKQEQTLTLVLKNLANQTNKITVTPVAAYTNNNGIVDYQAKVTTTQTAAKYQWTDLVAPKSVTVNIPAKSTTNVNFKLKVPDDTFAGLIDGGFRAMSTHDTTTAKVKNGMGIKNKYAMIIGATAQMSKTNVSPELKLNTVKPALVANTTTLLVNLENIKPSLFGEMTVTAKVTKRGSDKVLHAAKRTNLSMAPMSNFNYQIDWNRERFKAGQYTLHLTAKSGVKTWKFTRHFTIAAAKAERINKKGVNLKQPNYWWLWLLLGLLLLIVILFIIWKRHKKDEKDDSEVIDDYDSKTTANTAETTKKNN